MVLTSVFNEPIYNLSEPVLPNPATGKRRRAIALQGAWVGWAKTAFEQYFLTKMRLGAAVPWFERLALRGVGLSLVEPTSVSSSSDRLHETPYRGNSNGLDKEPKTTGTNGGSVSGDV